MSDIASRPSAVFTPEAVASINRAYADAIALIAGEKHRESLRFKLAEHMMFLARNGEADERQLCRLSVLAVLGRTPDRVRRHAVQRTPIEA